MKLTLEGPNTKLLLDNRRVGIGRMPTNQCVLNDPQVSGFHAEIIPTACGCLLIDLGGRNGTFVNGHRLIPDLPYTLRSGVKIRVGQTELRFWIHVTPGAGYRPADKAATINSLL